MKVRILSAIIALAILIPLIMMGGIPFAIGVGILSILGYKEIIDLKKSHQKYPVMVVILGVISLLYLIFGNYENDITYCTFLLPLVLLLIPVVFYKKDIYQTKDAFYLLGSTYLIGLFFRLLINIRATNIDILVYLLCISILTDTFAYAVGMLIGKHKMTKISPNKSWEGFVGGLIGGTICASIAYNYLINPITFKIVIVTSILSVIGQIGDLIYSKIKRENEIKDFSNIMPGHGGILDRIDSLSFIVIVYAIIMMSL